PGGITPPGPIPSSSVAIDLKCDAISAQHNDFDICFGADRTRTCQWSHGNAASGEMSVTVENSTDPRQSFTMTIPQYTGAGSYTAGFVEARMPGATETLGAQAPLEGCAACSVTASDPDAAAPFPKTLTFGIDCPLLCKSDTHQC